MTPTKYELRGGSVLADDTMIAAAVGHAEAVSELVRHAKAGLVIERAGLGAGKWLAEADAALADAEEAARAHGIPSSGMVGAELALSAIGAVKSAVARCRIQIRTALRLQPPPGRPVFTVVLASRLGNVAGPVEADSPDLAVTAAVAGAAKRTGGRHSDFTVVAVYAGRLEDARPK